VRKLLLPLLLLCASCSVLDKMIVDPATGTQVRVGDVAAGAVESYIEPVASLVGTLIPNPIAGAGIVAALIAAAGVAIARLRKKKV